MEYNPVDSEELLSRMRTLNKKFKNACNQVILLNNQIEHLQVRYDRAVQRNKRSYRYFLRLRLATLEGIRNMFYEYACRRADQLDEMQDQLVQEGVIDSDYDMDDADSDSETQWTTAPGVVGETQDSMSEEEEEGEEGLPQTEEHTPQGSASALHTPSSAGYLWPRHSGGSAGGYEQYSENTLSNQGSSDEETFPIERPESPESVGGATGTDIRLATASCHSDDSEENCTRRSPVKPGAAAKTISAIGQKLVNIGGSTRGRVVDSGQTSSLDCKYSATNLPVVATTGLESPSGNMDSAERSGVNFHRHLGESKDTVLKVRVTQDSSDAPRQAKAARLNNGC